MKFVIEVILLSVASVYSRRPSIGGVIDLEPVALYKISGVNFSIIAGVASVFNLIVRFLRRAALFSRYAGKSSMRLFSGKRAILRAMPPSSLLRSNSVTRQPTSAAVQAVSSPEVPPPTTTT